MIDLNINPNHLRASRPSISPYREVVSTVRPLLTNAMEKLKWDVTEAARRSRRALGKKISFYNNRTAVIVCNGPSLLRCDLGLLRNTFTIGLNKINLLFERNDFRPSVIVCINRLVLEQNAPFFNSTSIPLYIGSRGVNVVQPREGVTYLYTASHSRFARDVRGTVNEGGTVTFVALQLAFHLGFKRVALIGCDHSFATDGPANATVVGNGDDLSHFAPNYFGNGVLWQLPDIVHSTMAYRLARGVYEAFGREVVNCTEGGKLEVFRRMSLGEFLGHQEK